MTIAKQDPLGSNTSVTQYILVANTQDFDKDIFNRKHENHYSFN